MTIYFEINSKPVAVADCSWLFYAPCGCMAGVLSAESGGEIFATEEQAWKELSPNAEKRRRDVRDGWRVEIGHRSAAKALLEQCTHEPRFGVVKTPIPEGYQWARQDTYRAKGRRKHLVPVTGVTRDYSAEETEALCGASTWAWSSNDWDLSEVAECTRCQKRATQIANADSVPSAA